LLVVLETLGACVLFAKSASCSFVHAMKRQRWARLDGSANQKRIRTEIALAKRWNGSFSELKGLNLWGYSR
jgi:hypothetical protein